MPMPQGKKVGKYVTLSDRDAMNYRTIAARMTEQGWKMNHATARGVLLGGMRKIAVKMLIGVKGEASTEDVDRLLKSASFHSYVGDVLEEQVYK